MLRCARIMMEASHAVVVLDIGWTPMDTPAMVNSLSSCYTVL